MNHFFKHCTIYISYTIFILGYSSHTELDNWIKQVGIKIIKIYSAGFL